MQCCLRPTSLLALCLALPAAGAGQVYYGNDFEQTCDVVYWASACKAEVDGIGLTDENPYEGRQCARITYRVTDGSGWCYFRIPIDVRLDPAKTYVIEAAVRYETTGSTRVGFGHSWYHMPPGQAPVQGNTSSTGTCSEPGKWCHLQSAEVGELFRNSSVSAGWPEDCPGRFEALYIHTDGNSAGDKVTIWLDSVRFREVNDDDRARWEKEKHPFDYVPPAYPDVEDASPWGCCGSLEGYAGRLGVPLEAEAALVARSWTKFGFDTSICAGGMVAAPGSPEAEDYLGKFLDLNNRYGQRVLPSTYLTGYYDRKVPREACEAAIRRVVTRYRDHPALCAWWMIDEPMPNLDDIGNQWLWGKRQFEALDRKHPALGALCMSDAVSAYSQYTQVAIIDCYPLTQAGGKPQGDPMTVARWCELSWRCGARRIWAVQQAFGELGAWRLPTRAELRLMTYLYLSRGATGFLPYHYTMEPAWMTGSGHNGLTDLFLAPTDLGAETRELADTVMPLSALFIPVRWQDDSQAGAQPRARVTCELDVRKRPVLDVSFLQGGPGRDSYDLVVVCNLDTEAPRSGQLLVTQQPGRALSDLRTVRPAKTEADGSVALTLGPGDAAVLMSAGPKALGHAKAAVLSRRLQLHQRHLAGLTREAAGNGLPPSLWEGALTQVEALAERGDHARALALVTGTQRKMEEALGRIPDRQACREQHERATAALSRASRALEVWTLQRWPEAERSGKVAEMRTEEPALGSYIDALTALARCQHLLGYALLTGKGPAHAEAYTDLAALGDQAEAGVNRFVGEKKALELDDARLQRLTAAVADLK